MAVKYLNEGDMMTDEKHEKGESHKKAEDETFTIKKITMWQGLSGVLGILLVVSIFTGGFGLGGDGATTGRAAQAAPSAAPSPSQPSPSAPAARAEVEVGEAPSQGSEDAPVTLIEFSDFQCPFCQRFYSQTKSQIDEQYVDTGKVRFVYKHFPLDSIHPQATPAALASECAKEQGRFWEYHDRIFQNQNSLGDASYKQWASELGLDAGQFNECYDSQKYLDVVRADFQAGSNAGIRGTPGFLLNGQLISGAQPFSVFQQAIEAELAG